MINLPKRPAPRSRFLLVFCVMVLMGLLGAQMFLNRAGAQKQEEKKVQTTTDPSSSVAPAATTKPTDKELKQKLTPRAILRHTEMWHRAPVQQRLLEQSRAGDLR